MNNRKKQKDPLLFLAVLFLLNIAVTAQGASYESEILGWRDAYESRLLKDNGWLSLAGLFWLKEGRNTVGAGGSYDVALTDSFSGEKFGEIELQDGVARLRVASGVLALIDGKRATDPVIFRDGDSGSVKTVHVGSQSFFIIKREGRYGVRLRDTNSPTRSKFAGLDWFPVNEGLRIEASFEPFPSPKTITVPNVLGGTFEYKSPGTLRFKIGDAVQTLQPVIEEGSDEWFIIFRDETARTETYGGGRFLYAAPPNNGNKVVLDFNKAYNPPCAYTPFATCPLPPQQNRLAVRIPAGEKRYPGH